MSMILGLATVSDGTIRRLCDRPTLVWRVIAPDAPELWEDESPGRPSLLGRLLGRKPAPPASLTLGEGEGMDTDLDKAWHAIHYILTGTAWEGEPPESYLIEGGTTIGDIDVGYGPARALTAAETRAFREALSALTDREVDARLDTADMTKKDIYPSIWDRHPADDDVLAYVRENVETLREFLEDAVRRDFGVLIWVS